MGPLALSANLDSKGNKKLREQFTQQMSKKLRTVRKSKGVTQQQLAETAGLHLTYVGHLELGKYHPTVFVMWKIAKALGVTLNELTSI